MKNRMKILVIIFILLSLSGCNNRSNHYYKVAAYKYDAFTIEAYEAVYSDEELLIGFIAINYPSVFMPYETVRTITCEYDDNQFPLPSDFLLRAWSGDFYSIYVPREVAAYRLYNDDLIVVVRFTVPTMRRVGLTRLYRYSGEFQIIAEFNGILSSNVFYYDTHGRLVINESIFDTPYWAAANLSFLYADTWEREAIFTNERFAETIDGETVLNEDLLYFLESLIPIPNIITTEILALAEALSYVS